MFVSLSNLEDASNLSVDLLIEVLHLRDERVGGIANLPEATNTTFLILESLLISCKNFVAASADPTWPIKNLTPKSGHKSDL